jgi:anti-anti-sigma factor
VILDVDAALRFRLPPPSAAPAVLAPRRPSPLEAPATLLTHDEGGRRHVQVLGDLDLAGVQAGRADLPAEATAGRPVVLDLTRIGFLASIGVALVLETAEAAGDQLQVVLPARGPVRRPLDLAGVTAALTPADPEARA